MSVVVISAVVKLNRWMDDLEFYGSFNRITVMSDLLENQLLQLCTARTAWSDSVIRSETSLITESDRRGPIR